MGDLRECFALGDGVDAAAEGGGGHRARTTHNNKRSQRQATTGLGGGPVTQTAGPLEPEQSGLGRLMGVGRAVAPARDHAPRSFGDQFGAGVVAS